MVRNPGASSDGAPNGRINRADSSRVKQKEITNDMSIDRTASEFADDENDLDDLDEIDDLYDEDEDDDDEEEDERKASPSRAEAPPPLAMSEAAAPETPMTVVVQDLRKEFDSGGEFVRAVDGISFSLATRQFVAITGPSGCGKTTLLYMLGGLEQPTGGSLVIDGVDVARLDGREADRFRRKSVGFVFQSFYLIPNLTALENVMLPMEVAGVPRAERLERATGLLRQVGIDENRQNHRPGKLSGGQQQRVAIARALANDPAVILADEPTGNLDSSNSKRIVSLLRTLAQQGRTIIMVTHDRGIARAADVRMDLIDGRIVRMMTQADGGGSAAVVSEPKSQRRGRGPSSRRANARRR